jgi:hypothetical protein
VDVYTIWFDLKPGVQDVAFADALATYLNALKADGRIESWRLLRRKLGLGPRELGEWQASIETRDLTQLDQAFKAAATRAGETERQHFDVNRHATNVTFALMRDFPDPFRVRGEERF